MISKKEVQHVAALARIGVSEEEVEKFSTDLSAVLEWVDQLKEVDVSGVEPTAHITGMDDITREDKADPFLHVEKIIEAFPEKKDKYNRVKAVL